VVFIFFAINLVVRFFKAIFKKNIHMKNILTVVLIFLFGFLYSQQDDKYYVPPVYVYKENPKPDTIVINQRVYEYQVEREVQRNRRVNNNNYNGYNWASDFLIGHGYFNYPYYPNSYRNPFSYISRYGCRRW
jgi:hypothetical protein